MDIPITHQYSAFDLTARQFAVAYNFIQECAIAIADEWLKWPWKIFITRAWNQENHFKSLLSWTYTATAVASTRVQGWGTSLVSRLSACLTEANWRRLKAEWNRLEAERTAGNQYCYIRKYVIILGDIPVDVPQTKYWGDVSPASPAGLTPVSDSTWSTTERVDAWTPIYIQHGGTTTIGVRTFAPRTSAP